MTKKEMDALVADLMESGQERAAVRATLVAHLGPPTKKRKPSTSRTARWSDAASRAASALSELKGIQEEFESWKDGLPENLSGSALADKLETVCYIDLDSAVDAVEEAESADLPLGFGRD